MDVFDASVGRFILRSVTIIFLIFVSWVTTYPFIDKDSVLYSYIPDPHWGLLFCAIWGLFFIIGLMLFSLYHIYPHYRAARSSTRQSVLEN